VINHQSLHREKSAWQASNAQAMQGVSQRPLEELEPMQLHG
jgi:hypothetical protein